MMSWRGMRGEPDSRRGGAPKLMSRVAASSLLDLESKYNRAIEEKTLLEQEVIQRQGLEEECQRLKDDVRGQLLTSLAYATADEQTQTMRLEFCEIRLLELQSLPRRRRSRSTCRLSTSPAETFPISISRPCLDQNRVHRLHRKRCLLPNLRLVKLLGCHGATPCRPSRPFHPPTSDTLPVCWSRPSLNRRSADHIPRAISYSQLHPLSLEPDPHCSRLLAAGAPALTVAW